MAYFMTEGGILSSEQRSSSVMCTAHPSKAKVSVHKVESQAHVQGDIAIIHVEIEAGIFADLIIDDKCVMRIQRVANGREQ